MSSSLTVVVDSDSRTVLAATTALDGRPLDELVGASLSIVVDFDSEVELAKKDLRAYAVTGDPAAVLADPTGYYVDIKQDPGQPTEKVDLKPAVQTARLDLTTPNAPTIIVSSASVEARKTWLIVKHASDPPQRQMKTIAATADRVTFSATIASGDVVIALVEEHRPDMAIG